MGKPTRFAGQRECREVCTCCANQRRFKKTEVTADRWSRGVRPHDQERSGAPHSLQKLTALSAAFGRSGYALGAAVGGLMGSYFPGNALAFAICLFLIGLVCAAFSVHRTSYRSASITLAIVALVTRANNSWIFAVYRFAEVSIGIAVGLAITALWPRVQNSRGPRARFRMPDGASRSSRSGCILEPVFRLRFCISAATCHIEL